MELLRSSAKDRTVGFVSGTSGSLADDRVRQQQRVSGFVSNAKSTEVIAVLEYLNSLAEAHFEFPESLWDRAVTMAEHEMDPGTRNRQLCILSKVQACPKPFYRAVPNSARVYGFGQTFLGLKSKIRDTLTSGWTKVDINQAQLMIISALWNIPLLQRYIERCENGFWNELMNEVGIGCEPEIKTALKTALYSCIYGARKQSILRGGKGNPGGLQSVMTETQAKSVLQHPVFEMLFTSREEQQSTVRSGRETFDAFGNSISTLSRVRGNIRSKAFSVLCCQAQSFEIAILHPVFEFAESTRDSDHPLTITAFLHDGFWFDCHSSMRAEYSAKIQQLIEQKSQDLLGFPVSAEVGK